MKTFIAIITAFVVLSFSAMGQDMMSHKQYMDSTKVKKSILHKQYHDTTMTIKKVQQYTCTMHPEVITNKPGKCPKCGMTLVKKEAKQIMELKSEIYSCPMHSDVKSDKPGKCPKCGMNLVKEKNDK